MKIFAFFIWFLGFWTALGAMPPTKELTFGEYTEAFTLAVVWPYAVLAKPTHDYFTNIREHL